MEGDKIWSEFESISQPPICGKMDDSTESQNINRWNINRWNMRSWNIELNDIFLGFKIGFLNSKWSLFNTWVKLPLSLLFMLLSLYGINKFMKNVVHVSIPCSVILMLILLIGLLTIERFAGSKRANIVVSYLDIPCGWCLRWINIFFTPAFTLLPLSSRVTVVEAFEIAGVFIVGYVVALIFGVYTVWSLQKVFHVTRKMEVEGETEMEMNGIELNTMAEMERNRIGNGPREGVDGSTREKVDIGSSVDGMISSDFRTGSSIVGADSSIVGASSSVVDGPSAVDTDSPTESNHSGGDINSSYHYHTSSNINSFVGESAIANSSTTEPSSSVIDPSFTTESPSVPDISPAALKTSFRLIEFFDWIIYFILFIVGIVIYFTISYELPLHLSLVILSYRTSLLLPAKYKKLLHPIIVTGGLSMLFILIFAAMNKSNIIQAYRHYKTGRNYLVLFDHDQTVKPGAGDVLSSLLDVSIVSLSLPMFRYRNELRRFWFILMTPSIIFGAVSFFGYPPLCRACGIEPTRSLAFMVRSVTLALALPIVETIQGSTSMASVAGILSGILGVLTGNLFLGQKGLRVREDDYVTRGVSLGLVSSAIGAAHLLPTDPRASALATLTFFLYGMVLVILSVIPPAVNIVRDWVGLEGI